MKNIFIYVIALLISFTSIAQEGGQYALGAEESDPKAKAILDKVKEKYEGYNSLQTDFTLEITGEIEETQKGRVSLIGESYRVEMENQDIISNGNTVWFHLKNNNEVQINNPDPEGKEGFLSPADMLKVYDQNLIYGLKDLLEEEGQLVYHIEFKPREKDEEADFFKLRLSVAKGSHEMTKVVAFSRDGTQYSLSFENIEPNVNFNEKIFTFDPSKHPDIYVEDLREE